MNAPASAAHASFERRGLTDEQLVDLYRKLLYPRLIEEKMLILLRQGRLSKWFSGIGQEAISVGITAALQPQDYLLPLHRNLGVFTTRNMPLERLMQQWLGKPGGYSQGRERSFHFGSPEDRVIGMISHLGAMLPVADGLALASNLDGLDTVAVAFSGDGGTSEGEFHEAINVAAVWNLPVLFVIEQNGYGLSTPTSEQYRAEKLSDKAHGYGIPGYTIDGNNLLEVYHVTQALISRMRQDRTPVILECVTFRMRGHEEASGTKYVPQELFDLWRDKDPVRRFETWLVAEKVLTEGQIELIRTEQKLEINQAVEAAYEAPAIQPDLRRELSSVYAPATAAPMPVPDPGQRELRFVDAISEGMRQSMERFPQLVLMGQDIAEYGGAFKVTEGFVEQFGKARVRNTPICEAAIVGAGLGLSLAGKKAMVEMQFADFVSCGFNQIVNNLAKTHYRWGHAPDVVVRMPTGAGVGAGPYHSQSTEAWFTHVPGLKVVYPAFPFDAKGLLTAAFEDPNPVLYFEHKLLYRSVSGPVPEAYYHLPIGKAAIAAEGDSLSLVTYGMGVHWALELAREMPGEIEVIDLRSLVPWDRETVLASVQKTGRCLVLSEATYTGSFAAEIAAEVAEYAFTFLDAPVCRVASLDTPIPFHTELEKHFLPKERLAAKVQELLAF